MHRHTFRLGPFKSVRKPTMRDLQKSFDSFTKFVDEPFGMPKKAAARVLANVRRRFRYLHFALDTSAGQEAIDNLFYSFEHLPPAGKEYWFLHFMPFEQEKARQLFSAFGRVNIPGFQTNGVEAKEVRGNGGKGGVQRTFFFDKSLCTTPTEQTTIRLKTNELATTGKRRVEIRGAYPHYQYRLFDSKKLVANFRTSVHKGRKPVSCTSNFKGPFGYAALNIFLSYSGRLNGRKVSGVCELQKVIAAGPFIPWKWARVAFRDGSELEYWCIQTPTPGYQYKFRLIAEFFDATEHKTHLFDKVTITNFGKKKDYWLVEARDKGTELVAFLKEYGHASFVFSFGSSFEYLPTFAEVKFFQIDGKLQRTQKSLGTAVGFVEETSGIVL